MAVRGYLQEITGFIIRMGADGPGDDYRFSFTLNTQGQYAEIVGFYHEDLTWEEFQFMARMINGRGYLVVFERMGPPVTRYVQINPQEIKGRIVMQKMTIPHANQVKGDQNHIKAMTLALNQMGFDVKPNGQKPHYAPSNISVSQTDIDPHTSDLHISFRRTATDPSVKAVPHDLGNLAN